MPSQNCESPSQGPAAKQPAGVSYLIAVLAVIAAGLVQYAVTRDLQTHSWFMPFVAAVVISAWIGGVGPALLAALLGGLTGELLLGPEVRFHLTKPHLVELGLFVLMSMFCFVTCISLDRTRSLALNAVKEFTAQRAISKDEIERRLLTESELSERNKELRRHQAWLLLAMRVGRMGSWSRGADNGSIEYSESLEEIFGLPPSDRKRTADDFLACVREEERTRVMEAAQAARTGGEYEIEYRIMRPDGLERCMSERGQYRLEAEDSVGRVVGVTIDVTERKEMEAYARKMRATLMDFQSKEAERLEGERDRIREELARQDRMATIGRLSASIAHDLRNPLGVIRNAVYLQRRRLNQSSQPFDLLDMIDAEVKSADTIIANLMEMSRDHAPQTAPVNLGELVVEMAQRIDASGRISWSFQADPDPFYLICDDNQFRQVLSHLMNNAVEAMRGQGPVSISAGRDGDRDWIRIRDAGPGIQDELREKLFQAPITTKEAGAGLGLLLCRQVVRRHGGTIRLLDGVERGGAVFEISLPGKAPRP